MAAKAIVFDLDGTIWDSVHWYASVLEAAAGLPITDGVAALDAGTAIVRLINECGITRARFLKFAGILAPSLPLFDEVATTVQALRRQGIPLGVHTSLPGSIALPMLESKGLMGSFVEIAHAGNCAAPKPSPTGIHRVLQAIGVGAGPSIYYVGDRLVDALTARNAGVSFAWAAYGSTDVRPSYLNVELARAAQLLEL